MSKKHKITPSTIAEVKSQEVIKSAEQHAIAIEEARKEQFEAFQISTREETLHIFTKAMKDILTQGEEGTKLLLIQKIPLLCTDVMTIKADIRWIKWLVTGVAGIIAASIISSLVMRLVGI